MRLEQERRIKERLNAPRKLPKNYTLPPTYINVAYVGDKPLEAAVYVDAAQPGKFHRVMVICPACCEHMSMGRLNQHINIHVKRGEV